MRKKLTAALLALTMLLALLPTTVLASAAPETKAELISSVNYYYRSPDVTPENDDWNSRNTLRNVFSVRLKTPCTSAQDVRETYSFAVKAEGSEYQTVDKFFVSDPIYGNNYSVVYFQAPANVISVNQLKYTVRVTEKSGNNSDEKSIELHKVTFKDSTGNDIVDPWISGEDSHLLKYGNTYCILVSPSDSYPAFPTLADKGDSEFVGWSQSQSNNKSELIANITEETTLYAVFGERVKRVLTVRTSDDKAGQEVAYNQAAEHSTEYAAQTPLDLYIRNEGNVKFEKVYTVSSDHMNLTYVVDAGQTGVTSVTGAGRECYDIDPGKTLRIQFTPKADLPQGVYTDQVTLHNDTDRMIRYIVITLKVTPITVEITAQDITKTYGETIDPSTVDWSIDGRSDDETLKETLQNSISFTSDGFEAAANAKEDGYGIDIQNATTGNYTVSWKDGTAPKVIVNKATPEPSVAKPTVSLMATHALSDVTPTVDFTDPITHETIPGTIAWKNGELKWDKAGEYTADFTFTPTDQANYEIVTVTATVNVSGKYTVELTPDDNQEHSVTYDGQAHGLSFHIVPDHDNYEANISEIGEIAVTYQKHNAEGKPAGDVLHDAPTEAGVYTVTASTTESDHFAADTSTATLTIHPKELTVTATVKDKTYDGKTEATVDTITVSGQVGNDDVSVDKGSTAAFDNANAGEDKTVTVTLGELTGEKAGNYTLPAGGTVTATASITKKAVTLKLKEGKPLTKTYGETFALSLTDLFEADSLVDGESLGIAVTGELTCDGVGETAKVDTYPVAFKADEGNYTVSLASNITLTVNKAKAELREGTIQTSTGWSKGTLKTVALTGEFVNASNKEMVVEGTLEWSNPEMSLSGATDGKVTATWKFTPTDTGNYDTKVLTGTVDVPVSTSKPVTLTGVEAQTVPYDGKAHTYDTSKITTEPTAAVITLRYRPHMDTDADHQNSESFTIQPPTNAGTYDVLILATPTDSVQYVENSVIVHLIIDQATPDNTGVGPFEGREGTKLADIKGPETLPGVNKENVPGTFAWTSPETTITEETATFDWSFVPADSNYKPVAGKATVTMADDDRKITGEVHNLPEGYVDYVTVNLPSEGENVLLPGETVNFYADAACQTSPLGTLTVPSGVTSVEVHFAQNALSSAAGAVYAKIAGQKTAVTTLSYKAAVDANITDRTVAVGGTVTFTLPENATDVTWTVAESAAVTLPADANVKGTSITLNAAAGGTASVTVTASFPHPDSAKDGETITFTKTVTVTVSIPYNPPTPPQPSEPEPEPSLTPDTAVENGEATAQIAPEAVTDGIADAQKAGDDTVTVEPKLSDKADKVTVELPQTSVDALADAELGLTVKTEDTSLTLSPDALADLNAAGGSTVSVSVETKDNGSTAIDVAVDGKSVAAVKGGVKAQLPAVGEGQVLVAVGPDGTETVIKKSVVEEGRVDALLDGSCTVKVADRSLTFDDVAEDSWYAGAVDFASGHELFNGNTATSFAPELPMTRGMTATVLWRLENEQNVDVSDAFTDVEAGSWYADGILWATHEGIVTGYGDGLCGPEDNVTREQLATMLHRYAKLMGLDLTVAGKLSDFADGADVSDYAEDAMVWAVGAGLLQGKENKALDPHGSATRAEVATVLQRLITLMVK